MDAKLERMVRELHDREAIRAVMARYSRGIDRRDRELLLGCYHPDALDDHGAFVAGPEKFYDYANQFHTGFRTHQHIVTNHTCELEGETAHAETYWMFAGMTRQDDKLVMFGGRYIDRLEKRNGQWRIAARKCVLEWWGAPSDGMITPEAISAYAKGGRVAMNRTDCSYERPLRIDPERIGLWVSA